nr:hypothetical protein [Arenimonas daejeonensis]
MSLDELEAATSPEVPAGLPVETLDVESIEVESIEIQDIEVEEVQAEAAEPEEAAVEEAFSAVANQVPLALDPTTRTPSSTPATST